MLTRQAQVNHVRINGSSMLSVETNGDVYLVDMTLIEAAKILKRKNRRYYQREAY